MQGGGPVVILDNGTEVTAYAEHDKIILHIADPDEEGVWIMQPIDPAKAHELIADIRDAIRDLSDN